MTRNDKALLTGAGLLCLPMVAGMVIVCVKALRGLVCLLNNLPVTTGDSIALGAVVFALLAPFAIALVTPVGRS